MSDVQQMIQSSEYGAVVTLLQIDATGIGGDNLLISPGPFNTAPVLFGGQPVR